MLENPHLTSMDLTKRLAIDLLAQVRNPDAVPMAGVEEGEEEVERPPPTRIASKQTSSRQGKTQSEVNMESISFDSPLLSDISAETPVAGGWGGQVAEAEEELNSALDEALDSYDLTSSWCGDGDKEQVRK